MVRAYTQTTAFRYLMSAENQRLLSGSGSGGQMTGLFNVSRILTHNHSSDPSGWTALDAIGDSIVQDAYRFRRPGRP